MIRGLYAITPRYAHDTSDLLTRTEQILDQGASAIQYRDTDSNGDTRAAQAVELANLCTRYARPLIIHSDVELAVHVGASGVHLGKDDTNLRSARAALGDGAIVGVSCHASMRRAVQAQQHGASYVEFGDMYVTTNTPLAHLAPLSLIQSAKDLLTVDIVAIGGITPDNARSVIDAGVDACAVTALYEVPDSSVATQLLTALFNPAQSIGENDVD